jgi:hypothetical protein
MKEYILTVLPFVLGIPLAILIWATIQRRKHPPTPEQREAAALMLDTRWLSSGWASMTFMLVYMGVYTLRRFIPLHPGLKLALLILPAAAVVWFILTFEREGRRGDEFARQVRLDALTYAFSSFLGFSMAMWLMNEIWPSPRRGTLDVALVFLPLFYYVGLFFAKARRIPTTKDHDENR